jgi:hypothetical protein
LRNFSDVFAKPGVRRCSRLTSWIPALLLFASVPAGAQDLSRNTFSFSGFGTVGVVGKTGARDWGFTRNSTQLGAGSDLSAAPDSRLGGQVNWSGGSPWEAAVQGVLMSRPGQVPVRDVVEQAYLGYRPLPDTRIRLGRTSADIFLYADSRNVGYAFPWARPPVDFYGFAPLTSIDGIDLEQRWNTGDATWRARATAGSLRTSVADANGSRIPVRASEILAVGLSRESNGLLVKLSYLRGQIELSTDPGVLALRRGLEDLRAVPVPGLGRQIDLLGNNLWTGGITSYMAVAAQYDRGPWTLIAEGSQLSVPDSPLDARRAYVSLGWRKNAVTYYGIASRVKPQDRARAEPDLASALAPAVGSAAAQQAQMLAGYATAAASNYRFDQSTVGAGFRWDFAANAALKFQVDRFNVRQNGGAGWRHHDGQAAKGTLVSVLVDFVWGP